MGALLGAISPKLSTQSQGRLVTGDPGTVRPDQSREAYTKICHAVVRWNIWEKTAKLLSVFSRHISWEVGQANLWVGAKEIHPVSLVVSSEFCWKYVSDSAVYKVLTNKPTIDQIHVVGKESGKAAGLRWSPAT